MSSGVGRGRGWLKLNKNNVEGNHQQQRIGAPGPVSPPGILPQAQPCLNRHVDSPFNDLIKKMEVLSFDDDGIQLNQKIRYVCENWTKLCADEARMEESLDFLHARCLEDWILAQKVVLFMTSNQFTLNKTLIHDINPRKPFINFLQNNFQDKEELHKKDVYKSYSSIKMFALFSKRCTGLSKITGPVLIDYIEMLLDFATVEDLKVVAYILHLQRQLIVQNSNKLSTLHGICNKVRSLLISENLTRSKSLWLLLILDFMHNLADFANETANFYLKEIGKQELATVGIEFKCTNATPTNPLTIQADEDSGHVTSDLSATDTSSNYSDSQNMHAFMNSNSAMNNMVQMQPHDYDRQKPIERINHMERPHQMERQNQHMERQNHMDRPNHMDRQNQMDRQNPMERQGRPSYPDMANNYSKPDAVQKSMEKLGRPILGAGARLNKAKEIPKENSFSGDRSFKKNASWQHDDRFDTEYN